MRNITIAVFFYCAIIYSFFVISMSTLQEALQRYPRQSKHLLYGTAGFRENAALPLHSVFVKMGILAAMRSQAMGSRCIGLMVTASHNAECDNGVKLVDADGGMMTQSWEPYAVELANTHEISEIMTLLEKIAQMEGITATTASVIIIGRDTRPHSEELANCIVLGARAFGAIVHDMGLVTTPQLHFIVQQINKAEAGTFPIMTMDRTAALLEYHTTLANGYLSLRDSAIVDGDDDDVRGHTMCSATDVIVIDGSNGIGAIAIQELTKIVNTIRPGALQIDMRNGAYAGPVNEGCGAEHVQKGQIPPSGVSPADVGQIMCSYDGDADRIVFHAYLKMPDTSVKWVLLDGDKIAAILSVLLANELKEAGLASTFKMGVVQTAYANGASTKFLHDHDIKVVMAKTGVKYLHHKALEFDLGVYFEANGHGTVLMSDAFLTRLSQWEKQDVGNDKIKNASSSSSSSSGEEKRRRIAMQRLVACSKVINQAVGDAISDMLATLAALRVLHMNLPQWHVLYTDLPSKQLKVAVSGVKKALITCTDDETRAITPPALQQALDDAMSQVPQGRCFVRPSGTEDCVRVYAEASTQIAADQLAEASIEIIHANLQ